MSPLAFFYFPGIMIITKGFLKHLTLLSDLARSYLAYIPAAPIIAASRSGQHSNPISPKAEQEGNVR